jgi:hypothetical protein
MVWAAMLAFAAESTVAAGDCIAQEVMKAPVIEEPAEPEISRDGWRERISEARRRAKETSAERRANPELYIAVPEDPEKVATQRVLNDGSLQYGDIVSTRRGLFVFRGRSDQPRSAADFIALPAR